ncbi:hypothetical protein GUITHDRAFT_110718 [Guillardia theta CCMP2712]|uniref:protein O-GlcNAc transferase n=1 Tax=Guillardia theta (strain CCMP2712) TaxID=905079 RepID=L1J484_GUITC|nr:hypothetical protein GUITHDRAFT_110718 [Guillardia theta CCMP2712]EKX43301.1 hypothetical protein GUITHDRAFT_110718 [Guillardia theta CCMP2712]|eukprot:XP_005830281.1 hypothetical protein GUITHDRAFT_110718 [Guillardia theta CCMP2712]
MFQRSKMRDEHWRAGPGARTAGAMRYMAAWMRPWLLLLLLSWVGAEPPDCPVPSTSSSVETGNKGIELMKAGNKEQAATCFWRAADSAERSEEASEENGNMQDAVEAWQQMFDVQQSIDIVPDLHQLARIPPMLMKLGLHQQAVDAWQTAIQLHPNAAEAKANFGATLHQLGMYDEAIKFYEMSLQANPNLHAVYENLASLYREKGEQDKAQQVRNRLEKVVKANKSSGKTYMQLQEMGLDHLNAGKYVEAEKFFLEALGKEGGDNYAIHFNLGLVYFFLRQWDKSLASYAKSLEHNPNFSHSYHGIGNVYETNRIYDKALENFFKTVQLDPLAADTYFNIGTVYQQMKQHENAVIYLRKSAEISESSGAYINLGVSLKALGLVNEAIESYYKAVAKHPLPQAFGNLASALHEIGRDKEAIEVARRGVQLDGNYAHGYNILGTLLRPSKGTGGTTSEAKKAYETALILAPTFVDATLNLAGLLVEEDEFDNALRVVRAARRLDDEDPRLFMEYFNLKRRVADWSHWDLNLRELSKMLRRQMATSPKLSLQPFQAETYPISVELCRDIAAHFSKQAARVGEEVEDHKETGEGGKFDISEQREWNPSRRVKVGYVSSDFKQHPLSYLIQNLFLFHDKSRFEIYCYATSPNDGSMYRKKISEESCRGSATSARWEGDAIDSYISDRKGTPPEIACTQGHGDQCLYKEKMLYMPHSYQLNDHKQAHHAIIDSGPLPRSQVQASHPLLNSSVVYVNFNSYQKDIIANVDGSVLCILLRENDDYEHSLANERLITSPLTDARNNLLRMGAADLHLDTLLFNGHTTTTDSLWAGVPVLTTPGIRHASRVAASSSSLFHDVPHMSVPTLEEYVQQAIVLGRRREKLEELKSKVRSQRLETPLFDTQR